MTTQTVEDWLARALYPHAAWDIERPTQPAIAAMRRCRAKAAAIIAALDAAGYAAVPKERQFICASCFARADEGKPPRIDW